MKFPLPLLLVIGMAAAPASSQSQEAENNSLKRELYVGCTSDMRAKPQASYESCKEYLKKFPGDDQRRVDFVKRWVDAYEKVLPYARRIMAAMPSYPGENWFVYEPDLRIELPETSESEGSHRIEIARTFKDGREEMFIKKAEAVYPSAESIVHTVTRDPVFWSNNLPATGEPVWWGGGNDNVRLTSVVTASAVRYYYDLSRALLNNPGFVQGFQMSGTSMKYTATVELRGEYEHAGKRFRNVYVADLNLQWSHICGGLCGMGFKRNKVVVLDPSGNILAMFLDAPENSSMWVS